MGKGWKKRSKVTTPAAILVAGSVAARIEEDRARQSRLRQAKLSELAPAVAADDSAEIRILKAGQRDADATELERSALERAALSTAVLYSARQATRLHAEYLADRRARFSMSFSSWKRKNRPKA
jgi:hypothetical protein